MVNFEIKMVKTFDNNKKWALLPVRVGRIGRE